MLRKTANRIVLLFLPLFFLAACTVQLVPAFDAELVKGLNDANEKSQVLFSALSDGPSKDSFDTYKDDYNAIIGKFKALRIRAEARDVPSEAKRLASVLGQSDALQKACGTDASACISSSPASMRAVINTLEQMKKAHAEIGLSGGLVMGFVQQYEIDFSQSLFIETSLQRSAGDQNG